MKALVDSLTAKHSAKDLARLYGQDPDQASEAEHPVVRTHDETGARALYVCQAFTREFKNWSRQESKVLLDYLYEHCVRPEYQARHQWQTGDLVMWDNRSTLHRGRRFDYSQRRELRPVSYTHLTLPTTPYV